MNKLYFMGLVLIISFAFLSCHDKTAKEINGQKSVMGDLSVSAENLWSDITSQDYANNWKHWPGKEPFYKGTHPHGSLLSTYLNDVAYEALTSGADELPYGSIVIKENYMPDKKLGAVTVMHRVEGFNPPAGDWFWAKYKPDGSIDTMEMNGKTMKLAGKPMGCIGCHTPSVGGVKFIMTPVPVNAN